LHISHIRSSTGILRHLPVSIGIFKLEVLNFVIQIFKLHGIFIKYFFQNKDDAIFEYIDLVKFDLITISGVIFLLKLEGGVIFLLKLEGGVIFLLKNV
jgi:hypothetical protein